MKRTLAFPIAVLALPSSLFADGHGPVFGLATPTNSTGEWSFDTGVFGRTSNSDSQASFREQVGYGFTPHLSLFFTAPVVIASASLTPTTIPRLALDDSPVQGFFFFPPSKPPSWLITSAGFPVVFVPGQFRPRNSARI